MMSRKHTQQACNMRPLASYLLNARELMALESRIEEIHDELLDDGNDEALQEELRDISDRITRSLKAARVKQLKLSCINGGKRFVA